MVKPSVMIVDDEPLARQRLRNLIEDIGGYEVVAEAANGFEAMNQLQAQPVAIVLLDIRMPGMDGIELAQHLRALPKPPAVIFTTAYDHYAVQAFELNAMDYLLKPIRAERLAVAMQKAKPMQTPQWRALATMQSKPAHLTIYDRGNVILVPIADVLYFRAELKYLTVRTRARSYLLEDALNRLEQVYSETFIRLHRNALVATQAIAGFEKQAAGATATESKWLALIKGTPDKIVISRRQHHLIKQIIV